MKKPEKPVSKAAQKDPRKERLARQLRANLQRRKQQARNREDGDNSNTSGGGTGSGES